MNSFRITKYDPKDRDEKGAYKKAEWTSVSDVGKLFDGVKLTRKKYLETEASYLECIIDLVEIEKLDRLSIVGLEFGEHEENSLLDTDINIPVLREICDSGFAEGMKPLREIVIGNLREILWCKLVVDCFFIHFGFDYYMYIGTAVSPEIVKSIARRHGLFAEEQVSPYMD